MIVAAGMISIARRIGTGEFVLDVLATNGPHVEAPTLAEALRVLAERLADTEPAPTWPDTSKR